MVKNPPANEGDPGFDPWSRKIPYAVEHQRLSATASEPVRPRVCGKRAAPACHNWRKHLHSNEDLDSQK